jgi:hypothetical protein
VEPLKIEWEDFSSGGAKASICIRSIIGNSQGYDETYHKKHFNIVVGKDKDGYFTIKSDECYTDTIHKIHMKKVQTLSEAKKHALIRISEDVQQWFADLFANTNDTSRGSGAV